MKQKTIKKALTIKGIGLHSGCDSTIVIKPAEENFGIQFVRVDKNAKPLPALYSNIVDTKNCSCLGDKDGNLVSTVEHFMSAMYIKGIDNALVEINNQEMPIMDGSAQMFVDALGNAELVEQNAEKKFLKILKEVSFTDDKGNKTSIKPADTLKINFEIDFPSKIVGHQEFNGEITEETFKTKIAPCRTFCEKYQIDYLQSIGLIKGGSLDNAVVLDGEKILNEGGFRVQNECVNHKVLDAIGDLYLSGFSVLGELTASRTGHYHTNELLKRVFADEQNFEMVEK